MLFLKSSLNFWALSSSATCHEPDERIEKKEEHEYYKQKDHIAFGKDNFDIASGSEFY